MRHVAITLAVLAVCLTASAQTPQPQLTQVPPKPTCHLLFKTGPCADMWAAYNQAVQQRTREELQLYVSRQKDIASAQATAPLQQQIADLKKLSDDEQEQITKLTDQVAADATAKTEDANAAMQAKAEAHSEGTKQGAMIGAGAMLVLCGLAFAITRMIGSKKPQPRTRAASA
jgi:hypothetical protein